MSTLLFSETSKDSVQLDGSVVTVNNEYSIFKSRTLIRNVKAPTRANLDLALYADNVMLFDSSSFETVVPEEKLSLKKLHFDKTFIPSTLCGNLSSLKLHKSKGCFVVHWAALKDYLMKWDFEKSQQIVEKLSAVSEQKFGNDEAALPLLDIARLYIKPVKKGYEAWVRVDVKHWASKVLPFLKDENGDGFAEFYGQINPELLSSEIFDIVTNSYAKDTLSREEVLTWANELASFWYPTFNTDIYRLSSPLWPDDGVDKEVKNSLNGLTVEKPIVAIKGKPFGVELFNVLVVDGMVGDIESNDVKKGGPTRSGVDKSVAERITIGIKSLDEEVKTYGGGSYEAWAATFVPFSKALMSLQKSAPEDIKGFACKEDFLFFRNSLNYMLGGDLAKQPEGKNPIRSILAVKKALEEVGVDFLFVPVPIKPEVYPEMISALPSTGKGPYVNPYGRKFLKDLLDAGVEVVDLLPAFMAEKKKECKSCEPVFQKQDTHWGTRGLEAAAAILAERIKGYTWFNDLPKSVFTVRDTVFTSQGDIVARLKTALQSKFPPAKLLGRQVIGADGKPYQDKKDSPVLLITDSFGGVYQRTGCKSGGVSAHVARNLEMPVALNVSYGGGPTLVGQLKKMGIEGVSQRRLVVWMMVARDLYNYHEDWEILEKLEPKIVED
jgi:alginate O-acetyltransferase complex protein AlgJ